MTSDAKEVERTVGNIVSLLNDANKPVEGLATKMSAFAQGGKKLEVLMRFASGTGLWKMLNYVKAIGISVEQWNKSAAAYRKELSGMYTEMAKQINVQQDLIKLQEGLGEIRNNQFDSIKRDKLEELKLQEKLSKDEKKELKDLQALESIHNSDIMKGLTAMYGKKYAEFKLNQDISRSLDEQEKKLKKIREMGSNEDLLTSIRGISDKDQKRLNKLKGKKKLSSEETDELTELQEKEKMRKVKTGRRKGLVQKFTTKSDEYGRAEELQKRGLGSIVKGKGRSGWHEFKEHKGAKKFFNIRWAKVKNSVNSMGRFFGGLAKMIKSYLMGALSIIGSVLMWGAIIILAIILLKPVFIAIWESIKKHGPELLEKLKMYWAEIKIIMEPILAQVLKIWELFINPKSSFADLIGAVFVLLLKLVVGTITLLFTVGLPLLLELGGTLLVMALEVATGLLFDLGVWIGEESAKFMVWAWEKIQEVWGWVTTGIITAITDFIGEDTIDTILTTLDAMVKPIADFCAWAGSSDRWWVTSNEDSLFNELKEDIKNIPVTAEDYKNIQSQAAQIEIVKAQQSSVGIPDTYVGKYGATYDSGTGNVVNPAVTPMASGGFVGRSGQYLVGERGPEIVNLRGGSNVIPNHALGNTVNVHVNGRVGASDQELRDIARRVGSMINREINRTTTTGVR